MSDERRLGLAVLNCDGGGGACPGLGEQLVVNEPAEGRPPRGFFVRPRGRRLADVEVVIVGQNPGRAGGFERHLNRVVLGRADRFDIMADAVAAATADEPYWVGLDLLLRNLWPDGRERVVLAAEVVYCESRRVPNAKKPGMMSMPLDRVVPFCTGLHLEHQLALVPKVVTVICNGKIATDWFRAWAVRADFKGAWLAVDHSSGSYTFKSLFENKKLRPSVQKNWERFQREGTPIHLLKGTDLSRS